MGASRKDLNQLLSFLSVFELDTLAAIKKLLPSSGLKVSYGHSVAEVEASGFPLSDKDREG